MLHLHLQRLIRIRFLQFFSFFLHVLSVFPNPNQSMPIISDKD